MSEEKASNPKPAVAEEIRNLLNDYRVRDFIRRIRTTETSGAPEVSSVEAVPHG